MASLTRWVLAHKRIVVVFWVVVTLVGVASAGSATKALKQKFSVPGKEGWVTNQQIARDFHGTGGNNSPLLPVVTLAPGQTVDSPGVRAGLRAVEARVEHVLPGSRVASYATTGSRASSPRTVARRSSSPTRGPIPKKRSTTTPKPRKRRHAR
jgi:putative drug exporter of the RND superfamily